MKISYKSLNTHLKEKFGEKVYKLALDGGFSCPGNCIFCLHGSGDFATKIVDGNVDKAIEESKKLVSNKTKGNKYIAYFQVNSNTYGPIEKMKSLYTKAINNESIVALSIATRPDCISGETLELLVELNKIKPVWIELGLQTIHEKTALYIRRGYPLHTYDETVKRLRKENIDVIVHMIIGLPNETKEMIVETARYIGNSGVQGIKLQLLHVLHGTDLEKDYLAGKFNVLTQDQYIDILKACILALPKGIVIHRLTGDGAKKALVAPLYSANKRQMINLINQNFVDDYL